MVGFDSNDIISKPGLGLGLGLDLVLGLQDEQYCEQKQKQMKKKEDDPCNKGYPLSLTLGPPDDDDRLATTTNTSSDHHKSDEVGLHPQAAASSPSAVLSNSSSSIKREKREEDHELLLLDPSDQDQDQDQVVEEKVIPSSSRKKLRLTKQQSALLEDSFKHHSTLNPKEKQELARQLNLRARQVEVWFQNRRARTKLKQTEVECEVLKKCCETLREQNSRLQKELQHLKSTIAAKTGPAISSSLCQQQLPNPVASLTICPSCAGSSSRSSNNNNNGLPSPTNTPLLIGSSKLVHPHHYLLFYNQANYPFTQSSAAC